MATETRDGYNPSPHETEERLRLARSVANEGFWDWNLSTETVYFDPRYYLMAGYAVDEFPHRLEEFQQRVHPDDQAEVMAIVQRSLKGQTCRCEAEFRFRKKAGDYLWIHSKWLIAERDELGNPSRLVGTHTDITQHKQAEMALRASEELLSETAHIAQVGGWEIDLEGNFLAWTEETFHIHELEIGQPPSVDQAIAFYHPDDQPQVLAAVQQAIECGKVFDFEARLLTAKKNLRWVRSIARVRYREGRPIGVHGTVQDITDRKEAEQTLRATEQRLRLEKDFVEKLFDVSEDTIFVFEPATGKPVRWNRAVRKITGYSNDEIASLKTPDAYHSQEELALADEAIQKIYRDGTGTVELSLLTKDGKAIPFEYRGSLIPPGKVNH